MLWKGNLSGFHQFLIPPEGILGDPPEIGEVHVNQTEPVAVAAVPLEIVRQRPVEESTDIRAALQCLIQAGQIAGKEVDAVQVMHIAVQLNLIVAAEAVFCDVHGFSVALIEVAHTEIQHLRGYRPFQRCTGIARILGDMYLSSAYPTRQTR